MRHGNKKPFFCRIHEVEHFRWTAGFEQTNLARLAEKITPLKGCWIASGPVMGKKGELCGLHPGRCQHGRVGIPPRAVEPAHVWA
jgi:hypothetical protein